VVRSPLGRDRPRTSPALRASIRCSRRTLLRARPAPSSRSSGARTAWHAHPLGPILIATAGAGRVQRWGDLIEKIRKGDVVWITPGQKL
jgi:hypothetical protein